ncbi:hypothetical protein GCM10023224_27280 [Streptomonospora halophila]|uniref:SAM-dependent methyltransferase n=1 Tax=Streptomonospora halophila TaxID=427369 RepID=A0ABP9GIU9_9ACTN
MTQHASEPTTAAGGYDLRPPLAVWPCGQDPHTPPAIDLTRRLITGLSARGQAAVFLGHGDGGPLAQAVQSGRRAYGIEIEPDRVTAAEQRVIDHLADEDRRRAVHRCGDARSAATLLEDMCGRAALVVAWLPEPGRIPRTARVASGHLGRLNGATYSDALGDVVRAAARLLRPGGHVALVCGGTRQDGGHPDRVTACAHHAHAAGLVYLQHIIALTDPVETYVDGDEAAGVPGAGGLGPAHARAAASVINPTHDDVVLLHKPAEVADAEVVR